MSSTFCATPQTRTGFPLTPTSSVSTNVGRQDTNRADRVCDGTASPLVQALVRGQRFSAGEIAQLRKLLDELTPED